MNASNDARTSEMEIARVAQAIWEFPGPAGRPDQERWHRAREIVKRGEVFEDAGRTPRPVQPGFEDAAPGMVQT